MCNSSAVRGLVVVPTRGFSYAGEGPSRLLSVSDRMGLLTAVIPPRGGETQADSRRMA